MTKARAKKQHAILRAVATCGGAEGISEPSAASGRGSPWAPGRRRLRKPDSEGAGASGIVARTGTFVMVRSGRGISRARMYSDTVPPRGTQARRPV